jgi:Tol biopolymer transport system component
MARRQTLYLPVMLAATVALACLAALLVASGEEAQAAFPGKNGRIAFSAEGNSFQGGPQGPSQIYTVNSADGTDRKQLTHTTSTYNGDPSFSSDAQKIAWVRGGRERGGDIWDNDIWVMNADGTSKRQLTRGLALDSKPSFSPDGRIVAFERRVPEDGQEIYLKALDDARPKQITDGPNLKETPVFSPDGTRIAFLHTEGVPPTEGNPGYIHGPTDIFTMRPDGTGKRRITNVASGKHVIHPDWSPNGSRLVYNVYSDFTDNVGIRTIGANGKGGERVVPPEEYAGLHRAAPVFSPNGRRIAFGYHRETSLDIWTIKPDGTGLRNVTNIPNDDEQEPSWGLVPRTGP